MPKDSQPDKKYIRKQKANNQIPLTEENRDTGNNTKKQSADRQQGG